MGLLLIAMLIVLFSRPSAALSRTPDGVKKIEDNLYMPYKGIFQDVRHALDWVHDQVN